VEGIGPEVVTPRALLWARGSPLKILTPAQGSPCPRRPSARREADGVLFAGGAVHLAVVSWLRWEMAAWAGVRPIRSSRGCARPSPIPTASTTSCCARTARASTGTRGRPRRAGQAHAESRRPDRAHHQGLRHRGALRGEGGHPARRQRIARFACDLARRRQKRGKPGKITLVTKSNCCRAPTGSTTRSSQRRARGRPPFRALPRRRRGPAPGALPEAMDVVLCMNLYGDILSDLARRRRAGRGWPRPATSATAGPTSNRPRLGPRHAGKGIANPTATILSAALMLEHMGMSAEAQRLEAAVGRVYRDGRC